MWCDLKNKSWKNKTNDTIILSTILGQEMWDASHMPHATNDAILKTRAERNKTLRTKWHHHSSTIVGQDEIRDASHMPHSYYRRRWNVIICEISYHLIPIRHFILNLSRLPLRSFCSPMSCDAFYPIEMKIGHILLMCIVFAALCHANVFQFMELFNHF